MLASDARGQNFQRLPELIYLKFEENGGTTTENSISPPNSLPTLPSGGWNTSARLGISCLEPGPNPADRCQVNAEFDLAGDWTIEGWVWCDQMTSGQTRYLFGDDSGTGGDDNFRCYTTGNGDLVLTSDLLPVVTLTGLTLQAWHHFAYVHDAAQAELRGYLDVDASAPTASAPSNYTYDGASSAGLAVGGYAAGLPWDGRVDEFRVWNRVRSPCQLRQQSPFELPLDVGFAPYGLPPTHPDAPDPFQTNPVDPATHGAWSPVYDWDTQISGGGGFQEIAHAVLIPSGVHQGRVLMWIFDTNVPITNTYIFDPFDPANLVAVNEPLVADIFCAGQTIAADGTIVVPGGIVPAPGAVQPVETHVFDPTPPLGQNFWSYPGDMCQPRFYPTAITLNKRRGGRTLVLGGSPTLLAPPDPGNTAWETFPGVGSCTNGIWNDETPPLGSGPPGCPDPPEFEFYPRAFQLSDDRILIANDLRINRNPPQGLSAPQTSWLLDVQPTTSTGTLLGCVPTVATERTYGSAVLLHELDANGVGRDRVFALGGSEGHCNPSDPSQFITVHDTVEEFSPATNTWSAALPLKAQRFCPNAVILPTGEIFVVGGGWNDPLTTIGNGAESNDWIGPILLPEIYKPGTDPTTPLGARWAAPPQVGVRGQSGQPFIFTPRVYHSVALLLPDGSVFVAGGEGLLLDRNFTAKNMASSRQTGEVYHPPYQFYDAPTVQIIAAPNQVPFNSSGSTNTFTVTVESKEAGPADVIDRVVLLRPGAVTHHFDNDQRYIELAFAPVLTEFPAQVQITITAPDEGVGPVGHYMLFVVVRNDVTGLRVPTRSVFIELT